MHGYDREADATADPAPVSRIADLPIRYNVAADLLGRNLRSGRSSDKTAILDAAGAISFAELSERVYRMPAVFSRLGIAREQRVLLSLTDTRDFHIVFLGAIAAGVVPVPVNTLLTTDELRYLLEDSRARAVFVSPELAERWQTIAESRDEVAFICCGDTDEGTPSLADRLEEVAPASRTCDTHRDEPAFWLYTSGSTGPPKAAIHTHASMRLTADLYGLPVAGYRQGDVVLSVAKLFFAYGLGNSLTFPLAAGATVVLNRERPTPEAVARLMQAHSVSVLCAVPTFFAAFLASDAAPTRESVRHLRRVISAGEPLPAELGERFRDRYGVDIADGLGTTEMLHIFLSQDPDAVRYGVTGRPVPGYELRIVNEDGSAVGPGTVGDLQVKGPTSAVAYWNNRPRSRRTFLGEWTRTGDKYARDEEGWYRCYGRSDDMLKVGGIYVAPGEIEEALLSHDAVLEVAVVGTPDATGLIKPKAFVVARPGIAADETLASVLKAHVKARLAPYKTPRWIEFLDELPKTATGKIQRFKLRKRGQG